MRAIRWFFRLSVLVLAANLAVILWGAYVRASGSGAGCGSHWPTCNGQVIPRSPSGKTIVEFVHRSTSGIALVLIVVQAVAAFRVFPRRHGVRRAAAAGLALIFSEALVGAGLVLFKMVAGNESVARAYWMATHLMNTFALLAALGLVVARAAGALRAVHGVPAPGPSPAATNAMVRTLGFGLAAVVLVAISGSIVALGDTLFPARSLAEGFARDFSASAHLFVRLRVVHPVLALATAIFLLVTMGLVLARDLDGRLRRLATIAAGLVVAQVCVGLLNMALLAPTAMQIVHLLTADAVWLSLVFLVQAMADARAAEARDDDLVVLPRRAPGYAAGPVGATRSAPP